MKHTANLPRYRDLPQAPGLGARHAWGVFGEDDELGRINLLDPAAVRAAGTEVRTGKVFNLALPLNQPDPPWSPRRKAYSHHMFESNRNAQDDYLDGLYLQRSSQWDGLRHIRARELGFWGGRTDEQAGPDSDLLGIDRWAEHGIVGRGVLVDVAAHQAATGSPLDPRQCIRITVEQLREAMAAQGTELTTGDILLLRTGYLDAYQAADPGQRADFAVQRDCAGLHAGEEMAEFLWDSGVAAVVADNPAVEAVPGDRRFGSLHRRLIPLLGFALGELFQLGALAADCAADGRYTCMFVGAPLNLPRGVGSPANSVAIK